MQWHFAGLPGIREEESCRSPCLQDGQELAVVVDRIVVALAVALLPSSHASPLPPEQVPAQLADLPHGLDPCFEILRLGNFGN